MSSAEESISAEINEQNFGVMAQKRNKRLMGTDMDDGGVIQNDDKENKSSISTVISSPDKAEHVYANTILRSAKSTTASVKKIKVMKMEKLYLQKQHAIDLEVKKQQQLKELAELDLKLQLIEIENESDSDQSSSSCSKFRINKWLNDKQLRDEESSDKINNFGNDLNFIKQSNYNKKNENQVDLKNNVNSYENSIDIKNYLIRQSYNTELPRFEGNPLNWRKFKAQFDSSTKICKFTQEENLMRLEKSLFGKAKELVSSLLILPENVDTIIKTLENRFGKSEFVVHYLLEQAKKVLPVKNDNIESLFNLSDLVTNLVYTLKSLKEEDHIRNPLLTTELLNKLPMSQRISFLKHFERCSKNGYTKQKLVCFQDWLSETVQATSSLGICTVTENLKQSNSKPNKNGKILLLTDNKIKICSFCKGEHYITNCPKFKELVIDDRWKFVTNNSLCFSCLIGKHNVKDCKYKKLCSIDKCKKPHNILLHKNVQKNETIDKVEVVNQEAQNLCHMNNDKKVLLKIIPVLLKNNSKTLKAFALLDDASTVTLIEENIAELLDLDGPKSSFKLLWTNNQSREENFSKTVDLKISGDYPNAKFFDLRKVQTIKNLSLPRQTVQEIDLKNYSEIINRHKNICYKDAHPIILIGQDHHNLLLSRKCISTNDNAPALTKTNLGWVAHGNIFTKQIPTHYYSFHILDNKSKDDIDHIEELIKNQWKFDTAGIHSYSELGLCKEDKRAVEILHNTVKRVGNKIETGLLWKDNYSSLPESKSTALHRLSLLEKRMDKDPNYGKQYIEKMNDYIKKGYIKQLDDLEINREHSKIWYLPHFGVLNSNKPNKLRIVFDAASKSNGVSLNDFLLTGPDLYNSLFSMILNFRKNKIAFVADIEEMFLQVMIREEDRSAQRILWRANNKNINPEEYEIQVVFFGSACGPCLAQEAKNKNALEFRHEYPVAVDHIVKKHYMDDYLGGEETVENALSLINDIIYIHKQAGFRLCNWVSNSKDLLNNMDQNLVSSKLQCKNVNYENTERVLGLWWDHENDVFLYPLKMHKINSAILNLEKIPTKRDVLKVIMSVFDPLGLLSNITVTGKILFQKICESGISWDEPIQDDHIEIWENYIKNLKFIMNLRIPRMYTSLGLDECKTDLHIFVDASEKAYACVAYLRFEYKTDIRCALVCAKSLIAPLKPMTIPRLELKAALIGARLSYTLKQNLEYKINNTYLWSDSQVVLSWIRSSAKRFKIFVAQRIGEIQELTNVSMWHYISSKNNIADDATKYKDNTDLNQDKWLKGPDFLYTNSANWPTESKHLIDDSPEMEIKNEFITLTINNSQENKINCLLPDHNRFSNWLRYLRSTAWAIKAINMFKSSDKSSELSVDYIKKAEILIYQKVQLEFYSKEINLIQKFKETVFDNKSSLSNIRCIWDDDELMKVWGRLSNSETIELETKKPIILPSKHPITELIVMHYHKENNHIGQETIINNIKQKFYIPRLRNLVKKVKFKCNFCRIRNCKPQIPLMSQLPNCRIERTVRPFIKTGTDYFGPLYITSGRKHEKRYGVIFTCMITRAVHLEIADDLSAEAFIQVFRQFSARRGSPEQMFSDNGTNFVLANKEINFEISKWNKNMLNDYFSVKQVKWQFNTPSSPHMGGTWERLIRIIKNNLEIILKEKFPKESILRTIFYEVENIINSRPLTHVPIESIDDDPITPNHFLIGPKHLSLNCSEIDKIELNLNRNWRAALCLVDIFWKKFVKEYLINIAFPNKWKKDRPAIKLNDVVILFDSNLPRNCWLKGLVTEVFPGRDGLIRTVVIKTKAGFFKRPVAKLGILNVSNRDLQTNHKGEGVAD